MVVDANQGEPRERHSVNRTGTFMNAIETEELRRIFPNGVEAVAGIDLAVREVRSLGSSAPTGRGRPRPPGS